MNAQEPIDKPRLDLDAIRAKLVGQTGRKYWRSLEEVAELPEFQNWIDDEFPNRSTLLQINRRSLLKFMGASMALAGLSGCRSVFLPEDKVVPYVKQPEELVPGKSLYYASTMTLGGYGTGVLVEQHEGRPTQIVGNPDHPGSLGALDAISQAQVLGLYDPDRADNVLTDGDISTIETFDNALAIELKKASANGGSGLRILTGAVTSPTLVAQIEKLLAKYPNARWHVHEPAGRNTVFLGSYTAFGKVLDPVYDFANAQVIVSLDGDFLSPAEFPGSLKYARDFANRRRVIGKSGQMNRLYVYESMPSLAGAMADHRWPVKASDVFGVAAALAAQLGVSGVSGDLKGEAAKSIVAVAKDLLANPGAAVVVVGKNQPSEVHALAFAINQRIGAFGKTVNLVHPAEATTPDKVGDLANLVQDMRAKKVEQIFILGTNPAYSAPGDLDFESAIANVRFKVQVSMYEDETAKVCDWLIPASHPLEAWGDSKAFDGSLSVAQPLIAPLYPTYSEIEFLSRVLGKPVGGYDLVRETFRARGGGPNEEKNWRQFVHDGVLKGSASAPVTASVTVPSFPAPNVAPGTEIVFRTDPTIYDGTYANNGWLQELPKPLTKLTWDNVLHISPATAKQLDVQSDDLVRVEYRGKQVDAPVFIIPGHADDSVTVHLGYGRREGGIVATVDSDDGGGFDAYMLRRSDSLEFDGGVKLTKISGYRNLASTQGHSPLGGDRIIDDRDILRDYTLAEFIKNADEIVKKRAEDSADIKKQNLYPEQIFEWTGPQWGMTIDLNTCIGCNACVTACQAENNIPVVGKVQVERHREMHWLRIDRYYSGSDENPTVSWQPVACVQCEKAPCEPVCPVAATVHSHEGLNQMVYNRCVGTRYCSNNCPYKVRRFNYLNYTDNQPNYAEQLGADKNAAHNPLRLGGRLVPGPIHVPHKEGIQLLKMLNNPDVTVRGRGVMEKCTYCVQRINEARTEAKKLNREIADGDVITACQQACPTQTIVFGNIADEQSRVNQLRNDPRAYLLLEELQTRPRTSHLAKLRNPNPELAPVTTGAGRTE